MPKRKVTEETVATIRQLRERGKKDSEIARELDLDRRTVTSAAQKVGKVVDYLHWEAVAQKVDSELLYQHQKDLTQLAVGVQERTTSDLTGLPVSHPSFDSRRSLHLTFERLSEEGWLGGRTAKSPLDEYQEMSRQESLPPDRLYRLGDRLMECLDQHEPELTRVFEMWRTGYDLCQEARAGLLRDAEAALGEGPAGSAPTGEIATAVLREACEHGFHQTATARFITQEQAGTEIQLFRLIGRSEVPVYRGDSRGVAEASERYRLVLDAALGSPELRAATDAFRGLETVRAEIDAVTDGIVIRGRPNGRCELCPYSLI